MGPNHREDGVVLVFAAICIFALILIAGFAVDLGNWYLNAAKLQRAADAAALDGVAWTPDGDKAESIALQAAKSNGYDNTSPSVSVKVTMINNTDLDVEIVDTNVETYFTSSLFKSITLQRHARATRSDGFVLGNPSNAFGLGDLSLTSQAKGAWATISGWCNAKEQGDQIAVFRDGNIDARPSGLTNCADPVAAFDKNDDYDPNGYFYAVTIPSGRAAPLELDIYDAPWFRGLRTPTDQVQPADGSSDSPGQVWPLDSDGVPTQFTLRRPDTTFNNNTDNPVFPGCDRVFEPDDATAFNRKIAVANDGAGIRAGRWTSLCTVPTTAPAGRYILQVSNMPARSALSRKTFGSNNYALILQPTGSTTLNICTDPDPTCPRIEPLDYMPLNVPLDGTEANVYLARIPPSVAGKTVRIGLFDPGDGATYMQLLDPKGNPVNMKWNVPGDPDYGGTPVDTGTQLEVDSPGPKTYPNRYGTSQFNDRLVQVWVTIPTNYATTYSSEGGWWQLRYVSTPSAPNTYRSDTTTWSIGLGGTPIHLIK